MNETAASDDPFDLGRFVAAQAGGVWEQALAELRAGRKQSHWMWFVFPQARGLGRSSTAEYYGLSGEAEAAAFLAHPLLGARLREGVAAVREQRTQGRTLEVIFGPLDAMKFRSCLAIFDLEPA